MWFFIIGICGVIYFMLGLVGIWGKANDPKYYGCHYSCNYCIYVYFWWGL